MSEAWLRADWPAPAGIHALTTLRSGPGVSPAPWQMNLGDRCGDTATNVAENRRRLLEALALPSPPCWLRQVHGKAVVRVDAPADPGWHAPEADAAISTDPRAVLAVLTADCLPVAVVSRDGQHLGLAHAGWRGLAAGVIDQLLQRLDLPASQLMAWLGPAIGPQSFEVGPEVQEAFVGVDPEARGAFRPGRDDRYFADLYGLARLRLRQYGIQAIYGGDQDTYANPRRFHSYRRDGERSGRMATLLWRTS